MAIIKNGAVIHDEWLFVGDDAALPEDGPAIISLPHWRREADQLQARTAPLGLLLESHEQALDIAVDIAAFELIALDFPTFRDGRPYSTARLLRERYGFSDELRAVGDVARDQFLFMHRCGFDAFQVSDGTGLEAWLRAVSEITIWYQPTGDARGTLGMLRNQLQAAE
jgi:uncharacterized protein (DUF934 family)